MAMSESTSDPVPAYNSPGDITIVAIESGYRDVDPDPIIVRAFFDSIRAGDVEGVTRYLDAYPSLAHSSLSLDNYYRGGQSPLHAATIAGNPYIVALLAQRGAPIDELSFTGDYSGSEPVLRTPLMAAASRGSLVLVKLLYNDLKADDSIVAPDGAIALRLAVAGKHAEIVALLPTRRKGGWRRFKHSHRKAWRRIKKAGHVIYKIGRLLWNVPKFFLWHVPKYLLWTLPKEYLPIIRRRIVRAVKEFPETMMLLGKLLWARLLAIPSHVAKFAEKLWIAIKGISSFCVNFANEVWGFVTIVVKSLGDLGKLLWARLLAIPSHVAKFAEKLWIAIKGLPSFCVNFAKGFWNLVTVVVKPLWILGKLLWARLLAIPSHVVKFAKGVWYLVKEVVKWLWKMTTQVIPQALSGAGKFIVRMLVNMVKFVWQFMKSVVSFLHTFVTAIITRFTSVTLKDVLHALSIVLVSIPKWIWSTICEVVVAIKNGIVFILEGMGNVIYLLVWILWEIAIYVPKKVGQIVVGFGQITSAGAREVAWWINPKWRATLS
jgi:hypothetical protein